MENIEIGENLKTVMLSLVKEISRYQDCKETTNALRVVADLITSLISRGVTGHGDIAKALEQKILNKLRPEMKDMIKSTLKESNSGMIINM